MKTMEKLGMTVLIIIFVSGHVYGQIKAAGKLLIPTAYGEKQYKAVIRITRSHIEIECKEKIFRLFNAFNTPRYRKLRVNTAEVREICVSKGKIFILPGDEFYRRYRNLFYPVWRILSYLYSIIEEKMALIFIMDNPDDMGAAAKELLESISNKED
jgi:hypothetical protein